MKSADLLRDLEAAGVQLWVEGDTLRYRAQAGSLAPAQRTQLAEHKAEVLEVLRRRAGEAVRRAPLSWNQRALWFVHQEAPASPAYNVAFAARVTSAVDVDALRRTLQALLDRHAILRTTYEVVDGVPTQRIPGWAPAVLETPDVTGLSDASLRAQVESDYRRPFDLEQGPALRACLYTRGPVDHVLLLVVHHASIDGWSLLVLLEELRDLYVEFCGGKPAALPRPVTEYTDLDSWQREQLAGSRGEALWEFWRTTLAPPRPTLELPTDRRRPALKSYRGASVQFSVDPDLTGAVRALARAEGTTVFVVLLAVFKALLFRYSGAEDLIVGTPTLGRTNDAFARVIGDFVNPVPLRTTVDAALTFRELVSRVRQSVIHALDAQDFPLPLMVERLQPARDASRSPLFETMFVFQQYGRVYEDLLPGGSDRAVEFGGLELRPFPLEQQAGQFDLAMELGERSDSFTGALKYCADLFDAATVQRFADHFQVMLRGAVEEPATPLGDLPLLTTTEKAELAAWNATDAPYPDDTVLARLFEARVAERPDAIAVTAAGTAISFAALDREANQVARHLRALGVGPGVRVGLCLPRTPALLVALLGVHKAGGSYVPLDPAFPVERLAYMLDDSGATVLLTDPAADVALPVPDRVTVVDLSGAAAAIAAHAGDNLEGSARPADEAYVIYTSGSTGKPKGVCVSHGALVNFLWSMRREPGLAVTDVLAAVTTLSFDIAGLELYLPLLVGARLELVPREETADGVALAARLAASGATVMQATPATWRMLIEAGWQGAPGFRVLCGGEALSRDLADALLTRAAEVWNLYGPTETTIWSTLEQVQPGPEPISIGRPIANTQVHVLDGAGLPTPIGVPGELCIGGAGVALGYHNRPELSAERFVPDPFAAEPGARLYRTGDRARWRADGRLECLGRLDHQVKIRGFRIEPGEIEAILASHPLIREQVVIVREDTPGDPRLVAYCVPAGGPDGLLQELKILLKEHLPAYMLPSAIVFLDTLPLTSNGKVDRQALPAPELSREVSGQQLPLRTPTEQALGEIWRDVLTLDAVGRDADFFELGGHSLLATQVASRIRNVFQLQLSLSAVFESSTIEALGHRIDEAQRDRLHAPTVPALTVSASDADHSELSFSQQRMWIIHSLAPGNTAYNMPAFIWLRGALDADVLRRALSEVVGRHDMLRSTYRLADAGPICEVTEWSPEQLGIEDLRPLGEAARDRALKRARADARVPFDLERGPVLRSVLFRTGDEEHLFYLCLHHVAGDLWSFGILLREMSALYNAFRAGLPSPCQPLPIRYADYARWQRGWLQGGALERQVDYWRTRLAGLEPLDLPTDRPRPAFQTFSGGQVVERLGPDLVHRLEALGRQEGGTLFMTMCTAFVGLLHRYSSQADVAISVPIANRTNVEVENLIGSFVNTLVLRTDCSANPSFRELLRRVRGGALEAYAHQDVSFEVLVDEIELPRDTSRGPFANVLFNVLNTPMSGIDFAGLALKPEIIDRGASQFDLSLSVETATVGVIVVEYNDDLYDRSTIQRMVSHYLQLLESVLESPDVPFSGLSMLPDSERVQLASWNATAAPYPDDMVLARLFEARVAERPDAIAVTAAGTAISFAVLNREANRVARHLRALGVGPGVRVGLCLPRTPALLVALLGVQKAGGSYVPLDPAFPVERLTYMLDDSGATVLLTDPAADVALPVPDRVTVVDLSGAAAAIAAHAGDNLEEGSRPTDEAYVIYTSGSTGKPKGVCVSHGALVNFLWSMRREPGLAVTDVLAAVTTLSFDIAGLELYLPLLVGARLELVPREETADGVALAARLAASGATVMQATPATWRMLIEAGWQGATGFRVLCGGEALSRDLADALLMRAAEVWNLYGPTETTIWSTVEQVQPGPEPISIGRPIANTQVHVLDARGAPTPVGIPGELCIGGAGVAMGYHNRPELTSERFVPDQFAPEPGARLYRTGDRARWRADGRLECLGRLDHQVKIRGFRIELGEIETTLAAHPAVRQLTVVPRDAAPGDTRLVAYVVYQPGEDLTVSEVRRFLRRDLPDYMIPSLVVPLDALPLTANGKVDRLRLPDPYGRVSRSNTSREPPAPGAEQSLAEVWREILQVPDVGAEDNFFELGGHSLLALRAAMIFEKRTGRRLDPRTLFFQSLRQIVQGAAMMSLLSVSAGL